MNKLSVVGVCGSNICYHVATCTIHFNLICNMTMFWKSFEKVFGVCGQNMYYQVAACIIPFYLIHNMTKFSKSIILASAPPHPGGQTHAFDLNSRLICFIFIYITLHDHHFAWPPSPNLNCILWCVSFL